METKPEILEETEITMQDLKTEIAKIKKRDTDLNFRAQKTEEYLNAFVTLKKADTKKLMDELTALDIPRLKEMHIKKLVDIMPVMAEDVKLILQGYTITVSQDNMKKIANLIKSYVPKDAKKPEDSTEEITEEASAKSEE